MKSTFQSSRILLDKGVVRRVYEYQVRFTNHEQPTRHQIDAVRLFKHFQASAAQVYITQETANVLHLRQPRYAKAILDRTITLRKGRYLRRWSRRLRQFAFSREDAVIIAYASFGLDAQSQLPNIYALVTNDFKLANNFTLQISNIKDRFEKMVIHLPGPYLRSKLPAVMTTRDALALI